MQINQGATKMYALDEICLKKKSKNNKQALKCV